MNPDETRTLPVLAESLQVGKRERHGTVRIRKVVHEEPVPIDEALRDAEVHIDRVPVGRVLDGPVAVRQEGDVTIVPVVEERLVVEKRLVLVEEIRIRRTERLRRETRTLTRRREEVVVERLDPETQAWSAVDGAEATGPASSPSEAADAALGGLAGSNPARQSGPTSPTAASASTEPARPAALGGSRTPSFQGSPMHTVIAAFDERQEAQRALERLAQSGFSRDALHLQSQSTRATESNDPTSRDAGSESHGLLDSISEFFSDLFGGDTSSDDPGRYAEAVRRGATVLIVDAADDREAERARAAMDEMGGSIDVDERAARWTEEGWTDQRSRATPADAAGIGSGVGVAAVGAAGAAAAGARDADAGTTAGERSVMPVVQEELQVGKREVARGGIRVLRRVTETPVKEMIRLREERATVERRAVDRPATEADLAPFTEGTIEIRESREEPVVQKTARVVGEVVVGKEVQERTETISDTVRRADVEVERLEPGSERRIAESAGTVERNRASDVEPDAGTLPAR